MESYSLAKTSNETSELFQEQGVDAEAEATVEQGGELLNLIRSQKTNKK